MRIVEIFKRHSAVTIYALIFVPTALLLVWWSQSYQENFQYSLLQHNVSNSNYYLSDAKQLSHSTYYLSKGGGNYITDFHLQLEVKRAREMLASAPIFTECGTGFPKCNDGTWDSYDHYVKTYNKSYEIYNSEGQYVKQDNDPAIPYLAYNSDVKELSCSMHQVNDKLAYGLCINPANGSLWYHGYSFSIYDSKPGNTN